MKLRRTWGGRFTLAFFFIGLLGGSKIIFWSLSVLAAILTLLGHKFFVEKIRNKYGDDLFSLPVRDIPEVQTYFATLSKKENAEDDAYIKEMIKRRGY